MSSISYNLYANLNFYAKNNTKKRIVLVINPKPIRGPTMPVFKNLKKLNFIFWDFSIKRNLLLIN